MKIPSTVARIDAEIVEDIAGKYLDVAVFLKKNSHSGPDSIIYNQKILKHNKYIMF